ncbi:MAG: 50S ribosomal protein L17 [Candidatus Omnitrophica bacterium CG08_land_8_20_14_0_20_41_16]|uniref:50S ribosomal protein L17 n=1 Tax=Candidatus Sherwoodlollariibacterium unditelluris TaxID=1974757 RepID=A0A2G9YHC0_9BACT|nr:MAG: 50S ribosomal protein L17 [Candidatus Omnitrophica bacterium CG23_combo_of_CG06-09_8_20_14_all_41_10]PIS33822.1 MAG: 50S ribosomal protein L17 [Candidatus Omnitrophica bacterium CG08_land_8_20_14_0_20_41_16]
MRHGKQRLQLNRFTSWHKATLKSLAKNMIIHQNIKTTLSRARAVKPLVEKLISLSKANTLSAKRQAFKVLGDHKLVSLLFKDIGPLFSKRNSGGYTRIINLIKRRGDNAQMVIFELTEKKVKEAKKVKKAKGSNAEPNAEEPVITKEKTNEEKKVVKTAPALVKERQELIKKPARKFLSGIRKIFRKKGDSL